jgi:hypothetical protein
MKTLINTTEIANFQVLTVKYKGATDTKGSRIIIKSERFEQSKSIPYNHAYNSILGGAVEYLTNAGFEIVGQGEAKDGYYPITSTFKSLKD